MKKTFTSIVLACAVSTTAFAQTATDFTATDCNSTSHTLFNELDNGKVVVIAWVMPCGACEAPAKAAYNALQSFATSNPGKVLFYLVDDYGNASCSTLSSWVTSSSIGNLSDMTLFGNAGNNINMTDYGTAGMPKVVVVGGNNHHVFYNQNNSLADDQAGITAAITSAIAATGVPAINNQISFDIAPNPARQSLAVSYAKPVQSIIITNVSGQVIHNEEYADGKINPSVNITSLAAGHYMIKVTDANGQSGVQQFVKQ